MIPGIIEALTDTQADWLWFGIVIAGLCVSAAVRAIYERMKKGPRR